MVKNSIFYSLSCYTRDREGERRDRENRDNKGSSRSNRDREMDEDDSYERRKRERRQKERSQAFVEVKFYTNSSVSWHVCFILCLVCFHSV